MILNFNRDESLLVNDNPYGLSEMFFEKGEEIQVEKYSECEFGNDMWHIFLFDGTNFFVMKESVELFS